MTAAEREERIRKHLEEEVWPTEDEMRAFIKEVEENPATFDDLMEDLRDRMKRDKEELTKLESLQTQP